MMEVTSSAIVHCRLFLRRTYPFVSQRGHTSSSAGSTAVQHGQERSPWRMPGTPTFTVCTSLGAGAISSHAQRLSTHWKARSCSTQYRHQGTKLLPIPTSPYAISLTKLTRIPARKISAMPQLFNWNRIRASQILSARGIATRFTSNRMTIRQKAGTICTNRRKKVPRLA